MVILAFMIASYQKKQPLAILMLRLCYDINVFVTLEKLNYCVSGLGELSFLPAIRVRWRWDALDNSVCQAGEWQALDIDGSVTLQGSQK